MNLEESHKTIRESDDPSNNNALLELVVMSTVLQSPVATITPAHKPKFELSVFYMNDAPVLLDVWSKNQQNQGSSLTFEYWPRYDIYRSKI